MTKVIFEVDKLQETDLIGRLVTSNLWKRYRKIIYCDWIGR